MAHWLPNDIVGCVAEEFIAFCAGLQVNKRSSITLDHIRKAVAQNQWPRWLTNLFKEAYYVRLCMRRMALPQATVPSGESTIDALRGDKQQAGARMSHQAIPVVYCTSTGITVPQIVASHRSA